MHRTHQHQSQSGQVMLLTVLILSAVFLSATVIAGLIMIHQLNQVTNVVDSAKAIYAADTAMERGLFQVFHCNSTFGFVIPPPDGPFGPLSSPTAHPSPVWSPFCSSYNLNNLIPIFSNGSSYTLEILKHDTFGNLVADPTVNDVTAVEIRATGRAGKVARAFKFEF